MIERNPDYNWASEIHPVSGPAQLARLTFRPIVEPATRGAALFAGELTSPSSPPATSRRWKGIPITGKRRSSLRAIRRPASSLTRSAPDRRRARPPGAGVRRQPGRGQSGRLRGRVRSRRQRDLHLRWAYDPATALYNDPERAGQLLDEEAGWTMGDAGVRQKVARISLSSTWR